MVFLLIFVGALVTSWQAGMAVPDWPLSFNSFNPSGWWLKSDVRLEHGHRLLAACVALTVGVCCSAIWRNWRAFGIAAGVSASFSVAGIVLGLPKWVMAHLGIWPAAISFVCCLIWRRREALGAASLLQKVSLVGFVLVCIQATLGGLRVTRETAGSLDIALVLRVIHGCVAQAFLVIVVFMNVLVGRGGDQGGGGSRRLRSISCFVLVGLYAQLIFGASMRHMGAGLAISTFPSASFGGGLFPDGWSLPVTLNFVHTRVGALVLLVSILWTSVIYLKESTRVHSLWAVGVRNIVLVSLQVSLGIAVVWHSKPPTLASLHVLLGALLLASYASTCARMTFLGKPTGER